MALSKAPGSVLMRTRLIAVVATAVAVLAWTPSTLAFSGITTTGTVGDYGVPDNPEVDQEGARCFFAGDGHGNNILKRVRVSPPVIWGSHVQPTWVGWRFKIMRSTNDGATYQTYYKSPVWRDTASEGEFADAFVYENWYPSGTQSQARIKVQVTLFWYAPGSKKLVEGKVVGTDDNYVEKFKGAVPSGTTPFCLTIEA
jgi:hypothetical protein